MIGVTLIVKGNELPAPCRTRTAVTASTSPTVGATLMVSYIGYAPQEIQREQPHEDRHHAARRQQGARRGRRRGLQRPKKRAITGSNATITTKDLKTVATRPTSTTRWPDVCRVCCETRFSGGEPGNDAAQLNIRGYLDLRTVGRHHDRRRYRARHELSGSRRDSRLHDPQRRIGDGTLRYPRRQRRDRRDDQARAARARNRPSDFKASVGISEPYPLPPTTSDRPTYATLYNEAMLNEQPLARGRLASFASCTQTAIDNYRRAKGDNSDGLGYQQGLFRLCVPALGIAGLQPLGTRRHGPRPLLFILGSYYKQGGNYKHSQLRQRQQLPAL